MLGPQLYNVHYMDPKKTRALHYISRGPKIIPFFRKKYIQRVPRVFSKNEMPRRGVFFSKNALKVPKIDVTRRDLSICEGINQKFVL